MKKWEEIEYLLKSRYRAIGKGSIVDVDGDQYEVKRVDRVILLDYSVMDKPAVKVYARGVKLEKKVPGYGELVEGKVYRCADGSIRRLDKVEPDFLHYSIPLHKTADGYTWLQVGKTRRAAIEDDFTKGGLL